MFKKVLFLSVILASFWVLAGCGKVIDTSSNSLNNIPHVNGYSWDYTCKFIVGTSEASTFTKKRYFDGTINLANGLTAQIFKVTDEVASSSIPETILKCIRASSTMCYYQDQSGIYDYGNPQSPNSAASLILLLPLNTGKRWEIGTTYKLTCEAVSAENITVPAGTFKTIKVLVGDPTDEYYEWYADGVGLVKISVKIMVLDPNGRFANEGYYVEELAGKNF